MLIKSLLEHELEWSGDTWAEIIQDFFNTHRLQKSKKDSREDEYDDAEEVNRSEIRRKIQQTENQQPFFLFSGNDCVQCVVLGAAVKYWLGNDMI